LAKYKKQYELMRLAPEPDAQLAIARCSLPQQLHCLLDILLESRIARLSRADEATNGRWKKIAKMPGGGSCYL
jgi:hypothetical protein